MNPMKSQRLPCSFCARTAEYGLMGEFAVCDPCARRISVVARGAGRHEIWSEDEAETAGDEALVRFKESVRDQISDEDAESHANLAEAYREMGLYEDSIREAAMAVAAARDARVMKTAVEMLLSTPLLKRGGLGPLRTRLIAS
jgi:hypothetical protein